MPPDLNLRISPRTVQRETVDKLRLAIFSGLFQPGSRLIESQLCTQLGISRPSLREALRSLEAERLIEIVPNRGPSIPALSWEVATAIYEVRELLEVEAAGGTQIDYKDQDPEIHQTFVDECSKRGSEVRLKF